MAESSVVRGSITVAGMEQGQHTNPLFSGYHAVVYFSANPASGNDAILTIEERDECFAGEECVVRLRFLCPELVQTFLIPGARFELREGARVAARGTVIGTIEEGSV